MGTMKLYELVNHYHIGTDLTCAEAMFLACNEYYHLNLSEETRKMFSVMGLGMQTEQSCCGAFTVAVGIIGLTTAKEGQTDVDNMEGYQMIAELTEFMLGFYGTLHCIELQKLEIVGYENPCHAIVEALAKKLEELLADWERLVRGVIREFEENNSGKDLFHFDSDKDVFCVYSQYIDDLMLLSKMIRAACDDEKTMGAYLGKGEVEHEK